MKLVFLIESMAVSAGGPARVAGEVASALCRRGHEVTVGTLPTEGKQVTLDPGVRLVHLAGKVTCPLNWLRAVGGIRRLADGADAMFVSGVWGPVDGLALRLAGVWRTPVHIRTCGMLEDYILRRHPSRKFMGRYGYARHNLDHAAGLIVNTEIEGDHVRSLGVRAPIRVIPNGVVLPAAEERLPRPEALRVLRLPFAADDKVVLYLSRIHEKKGLHVLLEAAGRFLPQNPGWQIVVAGGFSGDEGYGRRISHLASTGPFASRIHLTGEVAGERKRAALSLGDVFVLPSASEGFSNAVLEAMSWGMPVVITEGCNFPEVKTEGAGWITPMAVGGLSSLLDAALSDDAERAARGAKARRLVEERYLQERVVDLYEETATGGRKPGGSPARPFPSVRRRRALWFAESLAVRTGGTALEVATIASALADQTDHEVTVMACRWSEATLPLSDRTRLVLLEEAKTGTGWTKAVRELGGAMQKADATFVTGIWGPLDGLGLRLARPRNSRLFVRVCGMLQPYILNRHPWKKAPARLLYVDHNLNHADGLVVNSESERSQVASLGFEAPIHLIRNGVVAPAVPVGRAEARVRWGVGEEERVLLYLARIHPKKNLHLLLSALARHAAEPTAPALRLVVGGGFDDAAYMREVCRLAEAMPGRLPVIFAGQVSGEAKEELFAAADALILPSESEGLPNVVLEAMIRGLPVIVTPGCNLPEVAEAGAGLTVEPDAAGLARALAWAAGPEDALREAGRRAEQFVKAEFSLERTLLEYDRLIRGS